MTPYVSSLKTDGKSEDRILIDKEVEIIAQEIAENSKTNFDVLAQYKSLFNNIGSALIRLEQESNERPVHSLAQVIFDVAKKYNYQGAFLGELNYAITRLIQRVPQIKVGLGLWEKKSELRYWLYAITVEALIHASNEFKYNGMGIAGVFEDIKDEYKRHIVVIGIEGNVDTTEVGIFFSRLRNNVFEIDVSSLSSSAKIRAAQIVFGELDQRFTHVQ